MSDHIIIIILVIKTFFVYFFLISSASVRSLPFCPSLCPSLHEIFNDIYNSLEVILSLSHPIVFLYIFIVHLGMPSYFSLLFSGTLHSVGYIFSFHPCFSFLFFPQLFVKPTQTTTLPSCIFFFLWDGFGHYLLYNVTNLCPCFSGTLSTRSTPLNLFVTYPV